MAHSTSRARRSRTEIGPGTMSARVDRAAFGSKVGAIHRPAMRSTHESVSREVVGAHGPAVPEVVRTYRCDTTLGRAMVVAGEPSGRTRRPADPARPLVPINRRR